MTDRDPPERTPQPDAFAASGRDATAPDAPGSGAPGTGVDARRRELVSWLWRLPVVLAVGGGAFAFYEAVRIHFEKDLPEKHPTFTPRPPTVVGPKSAFAQVWDAATFELAGDRPVPAIALRLPGPIPGGLDYAGADGGAVHLAAFSRVCTHLGCIVYLNRDLQAIHFAFNYSAQHPDLTCPCHLSIFDPTRAGEAVSGPAVRPLPRVQLELQGDTVRAVGLERG